MLLHVVPFILLTTLTKTILRKGIKKLYKHTNNMKAKIDNYTNNVHATQNSEINHKTNHGSTFSTEVSTSTKENIIYHMIYIRPQKENKFYS